LGSPSEQLSLGLLLFWGDGSSNGKAVGGTQPGAPFVYGDTAVIKEGPGRSHADRGPEVWECKGALHSIAAAWMLFMKLSRRHSLPLSASSWTFD